MSKGYDEIKINKLSFQNEMSLNVNIIIVYNYYVIKIS